MDINGETRVLGIIGNPIRHTMSPLIHNMISEKQNRNMVYLPFEVEQDLDAAVKGAYALGIAGMNVTVPYKTAVIKSLYRVEELAGEIGAVNTLVRTQEGFIGYNTDISGLNRELESEQIEIKGKPVLLLGAGGAARAAAFLCAEKQAGSITLLNRTLEKAEKIASDVRRYLKGKNRTETIVAALPLAQYRRLPETDYVVFQCTQIGLHPYADAAVIEDAAFYKKVSIGIDLIYNPEVTKFMRYVRENGGRAYNGLKMLLYQAMDAYELWNQTEVSRQVIDAVYAKLCSTNSVNGKNYVLIGFMGAGKTTVGKRLAKKLGADFKDTDALIEESCACTVSSIFKDKGETYFRRLETELVRELSGTLQNSVLSVGGGLPVKKENHNYLKNIGTVVYLDVSKETVAKRLAKDTTRPLLSGSTQEALERIEKLMNERTPIYTALADRIIHTDNMTIDEVVNRIIE